MSIGFFFNFSIYFIYPAKYITNSVSYTDEKHLYISLDLCISIGTQLFIKMDIIEVIFLNEILNSLDKLFIY